MAFALAREARAQMLQVVEPVEQNPRAEPFGLTHQLAGGREAPPHQCAAVWFRMNGDDARRGIPAPEPVVFDRIVDASLRHRTKL